MLYAILTQDGKSADKVVKSNIKDLVAAGTDEDPAEFCVYVDNESAAALLELVAGSGAWTGAYSPEGSLSDADFLDHNEEADEDEFGFQGFLEWVASYDQDTTLLVLADFESLDEETSAALLTAAEAGLAIKSLDSPVLEDVSFDEDDEDEEEASSEDADEEDAPEWSAEELASLPLDKVKAIAKAQGISVRGRVSKETLIGRIIGEPAAEEDEVEEETPAPAKKTKAAPKDDTDPALVAPGAVLVVAHTPAGLLTRVLPFDVVNEFMKG